jgi:hypothetical protein
MDGECEWVTEANAAGRLRMTLHAANTLLMEQYASWMQRLFGCVQPSRPRHKRGWRMLPSSPRPLGHFGCRVAMLRPYKKELKVIQLFMYHYYTILAIPVYTTSYPDILVGTH